MSKDVFGSLPSNIPKRDPRIVRVDFEEQQMGGRKSNMPAVPKNNMTLSHVRSGSRGES